MADLSSLSTEQLEVYRDLLAKKQPAPGTPPGGLPVMPPPKTPEGLVKPKDKPYSFWNPPEGLVKTGLTQLGEGATALASGRYAAGGADMLEGAGKAALPAALPLAALGPAEAAGTAALGYGASKAAGYAADKLGATPDQSRLASDVASILPVGGLASTPFRGAVEGGVKGAFKGALSSEEGKSGGLFGKVLGTLPGGPTMMGAVGGRYAGRAVGNLFGAPNEGETVGTTIGAVAPTLKGLYKGAVEGWKGPQGSPAENIKVEAPPAKQLTIGQLQDAVKTGVMNMDQFKEAAVKMGYPPNSVETLAQSLQPKTVSPLKVEGPSKVPTNTQISPSEFERAVINGSKTMDDYRSFLTRRRMLPEDIEVKMDNLDKKIKAEKEEGGGQDKENPKPEAPKPLDYKATQDPEVAKTLKEGDKRTKNGQTQVLKRVNLENVEGDEGNTIYPDVVKKYQETSSPVHPELRPGPEEGKYIIEEGHHRILAGSRNGEMNPLSWVPEEDSPAVKMALGTPEKPAPTEHDVESFQSTDRAAKENRLAVHLISSKHDFSTPPTAELLKSIGRAAGLKYEPSLRTYENAVKKARLLSEKH